MKYFTIATGLCGCYMHDSVWVLRCKTRRELKAALLEEVIDLQNSGYRLNKKHAASVATTAWVEALQKNPSPYEFVIPFHNRTCGIMVSVSTKQDWLNYQAEIE